MELSEAIQKRRALRSLQHAEITDKLMEELARAAQLSPSCFNNQPWRFVFVTGDEQLQKIYETLSKGNDWAKKSNCIVAVCSGKDLDCIVKEREYYLFDTGMAAAFLQLKATDLGLVTHPIAGFDATKAGKILEIPADMELITLIIIGAPTENISPDLSEEMVNIEKNRPPRKNFSEFAFVDRYGS